MLSYRWLVASAFLGLFLTSCSAEKSEDDIYKLVEPSIVLITYEDQPGNGTGFFVSGEKNVCTVLTARHVTAPSSKLQLQTRDLKSWKTSNIRRFLNHDLALVTFDAGGEGCPYKPLELGDSSNVKIGKTVHIVGFPGEDGSGKLNKQFVSSNVSSIIDNIEGGYAISYTATTAGGMSGSPVLDTTGKVVAVHGRAGKEVVEYQKVASVGFSGEQRSDVAVEIINFKWAIPINTYVVNLANLPILDVNKPIVLTAKDWWNKGNDLAASNLHEKAIIAYNMAIEINPNFAEAWLHRGVEQVKLQQYNEGITSYETAIKIKPNFAEAWYNLGLVIGRDLQRYDMAVASFNEAIKIKPNFAEAWNNRGTALASLQQYNEAITSYDKAIQFKPDFPDAWYNRGVALRNLKRYEETIASYDKAIQFKPDYAAAWNGRGYTLEQLKRYDEALECYDKAIKFDPNFPAAINNRKNLLTRLGR